MSLSNNTTNGVAMCGNSLRTKPINETTSNRSKSLPQQECSISFQTQHEKAHENPSKLKSMYKLVVFDKDGTLVCFNSMWRPWCIAIAEALQRHVELNIVDDVYKLLNFDPATGKIGKGTLAEDTHGIIKEKLITLCIEKYGLGASESCLLLDKVFEEMNHLHLPVQAVADVKSVFESLKASNVKIAVCTSDDRKNTIKDLKALKVLHLIDYVLCGDDLNNVPKPAPENFHLICSKLNVEAHEAVMIGDTPADTGMGKNSGAGLVIGVLSGVCKEDDLNEDADFVVANIKEALPFIFPSNSFPLSNHRYSL